MVPATASLATPAPSRTRNRGHALLSGNNHPHLTMAQRKEADTSPTAGAGTDFTRSWRLGINPLTPPKPLGSNISFLHFRIYYSLVSHSMASSQNKPELNIARLPKLAKGLQRSNPLPTVLERLGFSNTSLRLRNDKKFCDFVIECNGVQFAVHRVVLCSRSEYFERMCSGEFKVFIPLSYFSCWC